MARLPTVGGDSGNWGTVLNEYLETAHNADGTLKLDVKTIADLKAIDVATLTDKQQALVAGYSAAGDGGGGAFYYDAAASDADNGGTVIAPTAGAGRWVRNYSGAVNVKWFADLAGFIAFADAKDSCKAYFPAGSYAWPDATAWPMGLFVMGEPVAGQANMASTTGTRITSSDRIVQQTGGAIVTGAQDVAFLNGFTIKKQFALFDRCYFGGKSLSIDATGASPYYIGVRNSMFYPDAGETCLTIIGGANANFVKDCTFHVPANGRGLDVQASGGAHPIGWRITGSIDHQQSGDPVPLPLKSFARLDGEAIDCDFYYVEDRKAPAWEDGAPFVCRRNAQYALHD